ncbi:FecCD family ABC transporter permease [Streptomyces thermolineatus]|uniref:FecCD family ABC transporter permease n=1 Tax=Streptomyces thermolineatus TaxID=44033 RepID=UPI00384DE625
MSTPSPAPTASPAPAAAAAAGGPRAVRPAGYALFRGPGASFLVHRRSAAVAAVLAVLLAAACVVALGTGRTWIPPGDVLAAVAGRPGPHELVVGTLRLPRLVTGLLVGLAFGAAGALIQTVARNPLASPDVIGISHGAGAVTVAAITFGIGSWQVLPWLSVAGGLLAAALVHVFAWRDGLHAARLVLVGIGFSVALASLTQLFLTKGDQLTAQQAKVWLTGSLNGRGWEQSLPLLWTLLALLPFLLWAARAQRTVALDDLTATALGVRLNRVRLGLVLLGVVLASTATGAAGPVDFVALVAPQVARRLTRTAGIPLLCSALTGALVVVVADALARTLFAPTELPVGVLTAAVGAPYLMWLIVRGGRGGRGGRGSRTGRTGGTS